MGRYPKTCGVCSRLFSSDDANVRWCSTSCESTGRAQTAKVLRSETPIRQSEKLEHCDVCRKSFAPMTGNQRYCSSDCREVAIQQWQQDQRKGAYQRDEVCAQCGANFVATNPNHKLCSDDCRRIFAKNKNRERQSGYMYKGATTKDSHCSIYDRYYVYAWYDGELCFYIGKGIGRRAFQRHQLADGTDAFCERMRQRSPKFQIRFVQFGLNSREALLLESCLIRVIAPICNQTHQTQQYAELSRLTEDNDLFSEIE